VKVAGSADDVASLPCLSSMSIATWTVAVPAGPPRGRSCRPSPSVIGAGAAGQLSLDPRRANPSHRRPRTRAARHLTGSGVIVSSRLRNAGNELDEMSDALLRGS